MKSNDKSIYYIGFLMNIANEKTIYGKQIINIKDLRVRLENITFFNKIIINKNVLLAYLTGALFGIFNRLNRVCANDLQNIRIIPKFQHKNLQNEIEFVENLCSQVNFIFFSNFDLNQDSMIPVPKLNNLDATIKNLIEHLIGMKKQLENY